MTLIILNKDNRILIDEILMEYIYDAHENCDDSCGKKADYTDLKSQLLAEILKVIGGDEKLGADGLRKSDGANINNLKAELRAQFTELFNVKEDK